ncbi:MAG: HIT family protein [Burkholderiales bacterium]|nr:HIT family protein [Burkholderiales bacterium]
MSREAGCPLCEADGGVVIARTPSYRIVRADEPGFPGFYRVVWNDHVREFTDLDGAGRALCMQAVVEVETLIRRHLQPTKVNVASLGNMVAHLHWHVIARYDWDSHFPGAVWAAQQRTTDPARLQALLPHRDALEAELGKPARPA